MDQGIEYLKHWRIYRLQDKVNIFDSSAPTVIELVFPDSHLAGIFSTRERAEEKILESDTDADYVVLRVISVWK